MNLSTEKKTFYLFGSLNLRTVARFHVFLWSSFVPFFGTVVNLFYFFNTRLMQWPHKQRQYHSICLVVLTHERNEHCAIIPRRQESRTFHNINSRKNYWPVLMNVQGPGNSPNTNSINVHHQYRKWAADGNWKFCSSEGYSRTRLRVRFELTWLSRDIWRCLVGKPLQALRKNLLPPCSWYKTEAATFSE